MEREKVRSAALALLSLMVADLQQETMNDAKDKLGPLAAHVGCKMKLSFSDEARNNFKLEVDITLTEEAWETMVPEIIADMRRLGITSTGEDPS